MNHCKDCKHWKCKSFGPNAGQCVSRKLADTTEYPMVQNIPEGFAYPWAPYGYPGELFTHAEFGCVNWEAKES